MVVLVGLPHEIFGLEFQQLVDLAGHVVDCLQRLALEILEGVVLQFHVADLVELLIELFVEGVENGGLEGECAAADGEDAG